ncbi:acetylornithine deacetylase [Vibrio sp. JCM 18904]|nr:acetylornithine deacetylase [Vibrio sp. JCM 18904]
MKLIKPLTCALALAMSGMAFADVTVSVPDNVSVLAANGEKADLSGGFFASERTLTLPDGLNQVVFRFAPPYFNQGNDRLSVESDVIVTRFDATNAELTLQMPEYRNLRDAEEKIKDLDWKLVDDSGNAIAVDQDKLLKPGMQIGRDYVREIEDYNQAGGAAAVAFAGAATMQPVTLPAKVPADMKQVRATAVKADSTAEEMLHFWYQKADAETKARFKKYVNQQ